MAPGRASATFSECLSLITYSSARTMPRRRSRRRSTSGSASPYTVNIVGKERLASCSLTRCRMETQSHRSTRHSHEERRQLVTYTLTLLTSSAFLSRLPDIAFIEL